jgi:hypothetical protein
MAGNQPTPWNADEKGQLARRPLPLAQPSGGGEPFTSIPKGGGVPSGTESAFPWAHLTHLNRCGAGLWKPAPLFIVRVCNRVSKSRSSPIDLLT